MSFLFVCFVVFAESGSAQPQGSVGGEGLPNSSQSPTPVLGSPPARRTDFSLSFHPWRNADAVSSPGLAFSGLTPECSDLAMANPCDGEQL